MTLLEKLLVASFVAGAALPATARADTHRVRGCVLVDDIRTDSPTAGQTVGLRELPIRIQGKRWFPGDGDRWSNAGPEVLTDANGCFDTTVTNWWSGANEDYRAVSDFNSDLVKVSDNTHGYDLTVPEDCATGDGSTLNLGSWTVNADDAGPAILWLSAHDTIDAYDNTLSGTWTHRYPKLRVNWESTTTWYYLNQVRIAADELDSLGTFIHETGHFIADHDASWGPQLTAPYCGATPLGPWPFDQIPYVHEDAGAPLGCGHWEDSWEWAGAAALEGHASFVEHLLHPGNNPDEPPEDHPLNFDADHREGNVTSLLLDLVDSGAEEGLWMHAWAEELVTEEVPGLQGISFDRRTAADDGSAWLTSGSLAREIDLVSGNTVASFGLLNGGSFSAIDAGLGGTVCYVTGGAARVFRCRTPGGTVFDPGLPSAVASAQSIQDVALGDSGIYLLAAVGMDLRIFRSQAVGLWTEEARFLNSPNTQTEPSNLAIDDPNGGIFVSQGHAVRRCTQGVYCSNPTDVAGLRFHAGYARGDAQWSKLEDIVDLNVGGGWLYITDDHGVARLDLTTPGAELVQFAGIADDPVFEERTSPRAFDLTSGLIAVDEWDGLVAGWTFRMDLNRREAWEQSAHLVNLAGPFHEELYCPSEDVSISADRVVHIYDGVANFADLDTLLTNLNLTANQRSQVEEMNWIGTEPSDSCVWPTVGAPQAELDPTPDVYDHPGLPETDFFDPSVDVDFDPTQDDSLTVEDIPDFGPDVEIDVSRIEVVPPSLPPVNPLPHSGCAGVPDAEARAAMDAAAQGDPTPPVQVQLMRVD